MKRMVLVLIGVSLFACGEKKSILLSDDSQLVDISSDKSKITPPDRSSSLLTENSQETWEKSAEDHASEDEVAFGLTSAQGGVKYNGKIGIVNTKKGPDKKPSPFYNQHYTKEVMGALWYYDYGPTANAVDFPGKDIRRLYGYWKPLLTRSAEQIQEDARLARAQVDPKVKNVWWYIANEPNLPGQADLLPEDFAKIYHHYHKNLKLGDPNCKIIGPAIVYWGWSHLGRHDGKAWYETFRNTWLGNDQLKAYSESVLGSGKTYPPFDAFNLHIYHYRVNDMKNDFARMYNDLQKYPESKKKKIWITEIGNLYLPASEWISEVPKLVDWINTDNRIQKAFWFTAHNDQMGEHFWGTTTLLNNDGSLTQLGDIFKRKILGDGTPPVQYPVVYNNREFYGRDIQSAPATISSLEECIRRCQEFGNVCKGLVLTNRGYCHLKSIILPDQLTVGNGYTTVAVRP